MYNSGRFGICSSHLYSSLKIGTLKAPIWNFLLLTKIKWNEINKINGNPITGLDRPWGFQEVEARRFQDSRHMKVARLSALSTGRLYPPGNIPGTHFCYSWVTLRAIARAVWAGRIMAMKNSNETIGNRTCDLSACSAVPQPTALPRAP